MNKSDVFKIGIGTWKIDSDNFEKDLDCLKYSFENGQNYLALFMLYNNRWNWSHNRPNSKSR